MAPLTILLFDIDGVLVLPGGYRKSYLDTVHSFFEQFGMPEFALDERIPETFELYGIPAEWDMAPLTISAFLNWYAEHHPGRPPFNRLADVTRLTEVGSSRAFAEGLLEKIPLFAKLPGFMENPTLKVYQHCLREKERSVFPMIWNDPILEEILSDSLNIYRSPFFQRLETYILGTETFEKSFRIKTKPGIPSNLETIDLPIINPTYQRKIIDGNGVEFHACTMTARPNIVPADLPRTDDLLYSSIPEAEIAMEMLHWSPNGVRMIGVGSLNYFERQAGDAKDSWLKPSPIHALAAALYAAGATLTEAMRIAVEAVRLWEAGVAQPNVFQDMLNPAVPIRLAVFEDSTSGIEATMRAAEVLRAFGYAVELTCYGIITTPEKKERLHALGARVFGDVNAALDDFFAAAPSTEIPNVPIR